MRLSFDHYNFQILQENSENFQEFYDELMHGKIHGTLPLNKEIFSRALGLFRQIFPHRFPQQGDSGQRSILDTSDTVKDNEKPLGLSAEEILMNELLAESQRSFGK